MENKEEKQFGFAIERILDTGFFIREFLKVEEDKIKVGYGMKFLFDTDNDWIDYDISANFKEISSDITFVFGSVLTRFFVKDLAGFVDDKKNIVFPDQSLETLFSIAFTHMRAILSKNIAGSKYSNIIMVPVINPHKVFNELLQMNIENAKKMQDELNNKKADL
ncbi:MAG: hypothetical protein V5804_14980 [Mucilaginibacter sp.]|uniref:hypothetical protein n=1 Tax=Mucilaginibacter sp. TaxID=1882438 RepID=UPI0034E60CA4